MTLLIFVLVQIVVAFVFYRVVIRPLPDSINREIIERHVRNDFTNIAEDRASVVRLKLLELEQERVDAMVKLAALKNRKNLTTEEKELRVAYRRTVERLGKQIDDLQGQIDAIYGSDVAKLLRKFEENRFVKALNGYLDNKGNKAKMAGARRSSSRK